MMIPALDAATIPLLPASVSCSTDRGNAENLKRRIMPKKEYQIRHDMSDISLGTQ